MNLGFASGVEPDFMETLSALRTKTARKPELILNQVFVPLNRLIVD